ncbi:MAG: DUF72 domain-containing protein [Clostridia bacterium]|nr:DUF72 domain-containing protein [Clostridia bacterium]
MAILCGTCAWSDHQGFYPEGIRPNERLVYYARHFPVVEVDATFYHPASRRNAQRWAEVTPPGFRMDVKAYRALTRHVRGEGAPSREEVETHARGFVEALEPLRRAGKLGAVLLQFPPWFVHNAGNRTYLAWLAGLLRPLRVAVEFRHRSWFSGAAAERTLRFLRDLGLIHVVVDEPQVGSGSVPPVVEATCEDLAIVRFHGRNAATWYARTASSGERFRYLYSREELAQWVEPLQRLAGQVREVHVLMNNNYGDYAVRNAFDLMELLGLLPAGERLLAAGVGERPDNR